MIALVWKKKVPFDLLNRFIIYLRISEFMFVTVRSWCIPESLTNWNYLKCFSNEIIIWLAITHQMSSHIKELASHVESCFLLCMLSLVNKFACVFVFDTIDSSSALLPSPSCENFELVFSSLSRCKIWVQTLAVWFGNHDIDRMLLSHPARERRTQKMVRQYPRQPVSMPQVHF